MQLHKSFQIVGEFRAVFGQAPREGVARGVVRVANVAAAGRLGKTCRLLTIPPTEIPPKPTP